MVTNTHFFVFNSKFFQPVYTEIFPISEPLQIRVWFTEKLQFHLLKFSGTEGKVSGRDLISERLSNLPDTKGKFLSGSTLHVLKVYKDSLGGLGAQIYGILGIQVTPWNVLNIRLN